MWFTLCQFPSYQRKLPKFIAETPGMDICTVPYARWVSRPAGQLAQFSWERARTAQGRSYALAAVFAYNIGAHVCAVVKREPRNRDNGVSDVWALTAYWRRLPTAIGTRHRACAPRYRSQISYPFRGHVRGSCEFDTLFLRFPRFRYPKRDTRVTRLVAKKIPFYAFLFTAFTRMMYMYRPQWDIPPPPPPRVLLKILNKFLKKV